MGKARDMIHCYYDNALEDLVFITPENLLYGSIDGKYWAGVSLFEIELVHQRKARFEYIGSL